MWNAALPPADLIIETVFLASFCEVFALTITRRARGERAADRAADVARAAGDERDLAGGSCRASFPPPIAHPQFPGPQQPAEDGDVAEQMMRLLLRLRDPASARNDGDRGRHDREHVRQ